MTDRYEGLAAGVGSLLTSGKWTDFKVICHDRTFNVHKAVVCSQSAFFEAAVEGRFRESQENKIDLSEDDVEVVEVLINYPSYERPSTTKLEKNEVGKGKGKEKKPKTRTWDMHFHLKVYSIAQRCFVEGLQTLSATELRCLAETKWDTDEFREIVISIYNSTVGRDDLMREMVVRVLAEDAAHAVTRGRNAEQFTALVEIDGGLAAAVALKVAQKQGQGYHQSLTPGLTCPTRQLQRTMDCLIRVTFLRTISFTALSRYGTSGQNCARTGGLSRIL